MLTLSSSRYLATICLLVHVGALLLLIPIDAPMSFRFLLGLLIVVSLYRALTQHAWRTSAKAVKALRWDDEGGLSVLLGQDQTWRAATIRSRFVHRWLVLLSVKPAASALPMPLAIAADALDAENFRRLRATLLARPRTPAE